MEPTESCVNTEGNLMTSRTERFKKRKEILENNKSQPFVSGVVDQNHVDNILNNDIDFKKLESLDYSTDLNYSLNADSEEVEALLFELKDSFNKERMEQLLDETKNGIISSIAVPFGLGKVLSAYDKVGGNVDTVNNAREGVYATNKEEKAYENRGSYDSHKVHSDKQYTDVNRKHAEQQKSKGVEDGYSDETIHVNNKRNLDHVVSAKQTHDDAGRVLSGINTEDLANIDANLTSTSESVNKSKGAKSPEEYATHLEATSTDRKERINSLKNKDKDLTDKERKELQKLISIDNTDSDKIRNRGNIAQKAQDDKINKEYYLSNKFLKSSLGTGVNEGVKMGAQQAFGVLLVEFLSSSFTEMQKAFNEGLEGESLYKDIKIRLTRIGKNLSSKWKDVIQGFSGGFISGFISNLITTIINMFITTGKRLVRIIREGVFSILKALKFMLSPPENMLYGEVMHEAMKLIAVGGIVIAGVALEEVVEKLVLSIPFLVPFASIVTAVIVGSLTAIAMALVVYLIDKMDLLGVIKIEQTKYVLNSLDEGIQETLKRCEDVAEEIDVFLIPA